jgi:hypothetical protein
MGITQSQQSRSKREREADADAEVTGENTVQAPFPIANKKLAVVMTIAVSGDDSDGAETEVDTDIVDVPVSDDTEIEEADTNNEAAVDNSDDAEMEEADNDVTVAVTVEAARTVFAAASPSAADLMSDWSDEPLTAARASTHRRVVIDIDSEEDEVPEEVGDTEFDNDHTVDVIEAAADKCGVTAAVVMEQFTISCKHLADSGLGVYLSSAISGKFDRERQQTYFSRATGFGQFAYEKVRIEAKNYCILF